MGKRQGLQTLGSMAGIGALVGAGVLAGALSVRRERDSRSDDAPKTTWRDKPGSLALVGRSVTIRKPRAELYAFWRDFGNLARFMENLESVQPEAGTDKRATWVVKAPAGRTVNLVTEVTEDKDGEVIAWQSTDESDIETKGEVRFADAPGDRGTRVTLTISYKAPGGALGRGIASLFLREPEIQARHDLKRFKMLMETGEIATSARTNEQTRANQQENS